MKNTIVVLIMLVLSIPVFAQLDNKSDALQGIQFLNPEKKQFGLMHINNKLWNYKEFMSGYNNLRGPEKNSITKRVTFMDGPVIFSVAPTFETTYKSKTLYQKYASINTEPSSALQLLGIASSIAAGVFFPSYTRQENLFLNGSRATEDAYLKSTYRKEGWIPIQ